MFLPLFKNQLVVLAAPSNAWPCDLRRSRAACRSAVRHGFCAGSSLWTRRGYGDRRLVGGTFFINIIILTIQRRRRGRRTMMMTVNDNDPSHPCASMLVFRPPFPADTKCLLLCSTVFKKYDIYIEGCFRSRRFRHELGARRSTCLSPCIARSMGQAQRSAYARLTFCTWVREHQMGRRGRCHHLFAKMTKMRGMCFLPRIEGPVTTPPNHFVFR